MQSRFKSLNYHPGNRWELFWPYENPASAGVLQQVWASTLRALQRGAFGLSGPSLVSRTGTSGLCVRRLGFTLLEDIPPNPLGHTKIQPDDELHFPPSFFEQISAKVCPMLRNLQGQCQSGVTVAINPICWIALCPLRRSDPLSPEWNRIPPAAPKVLISLPIVARATAPPSKTASPITELHFSRREIKQSTDYLFPLKKVLNQTITRPEQQKLAGIVGVFGVFFAPTASFLCGITGSGDKIP